MITVFEREHLETRIKRRIALIMVILMTITLSIGTASAKTAEYKTTQQFIDYLDVKKIKYNLIGVTDGTEVVTVSSNMDNYDSVTCTLLFDDDCEQVSLRMWDIVKTSAGKNFILSTMNELNNGYKRAKFTFDEEKETIDVETDLYIAVDHCDECVSKTMLSLFVIVDSDDVAKKLHALE